MNQQGITNVDRGGKFRDFKSHLGIMLFIYCLYFIFCVVAQEKSRIEVYWRPLSHSASALVFMSRRTDMPYLYHTSLAKLNYDAGNYEVRTPSVSYPVYSSLD